MRKQRLVDFKCFILAHLHWMGPGLEPGQVNVKVKVRLLSHVQLFATPWTVAYQASPSMGFSRKECWSGLPFPSPGDLPDPRNQTRVSHIAGRRFYHMNHQGSPLIKILPTDIQIRCTLDYFPWRESYNFNKKKWFNSQPVLYKYDAITSTSKTCS